jgi:hypothetical protein
MEVIRGGAGIGTTTPNDEPRRATSMNSKSGAGADNGEPREDELEQLLLLLSEPTRGRGSVADAVEELHEAGLITPS